MKIKSLQEQLVADPVYVAAYSQLAELRKDFQTEAAPLFAPFIPENWLEECEKANLQKIMWCGSATYGWIENGNLHPSEVTKQALENSVENWASQSEFWKTMGRAGHISSDKKLSPTDIRKKYFIWNNLWKIGGHAGEPNTKLKRAQLELSIMCLRKEIEYAKPEIVIFHTGYLASIFTQRYFEIDKAISTRASDITGVYPAPEFPKHIWASRRRGISRLTAEEIATIIGEVV